MAHCHHVIPSDCVWHVWDIPTLGHTTHTRLPYCTPPPSDKPPPLAQGHLTSFPSFLTREQG